MTIERAIEKRRSRWKESEDIRQDDRFIDRFAYFALTDPDWREALRRDPYLLIEGVMQVVDKEGKVVPFFLNAAQRRVLDVIRREGIDRPFFLLKGRQQGMTTLLTAMQLCLCLTRRNFAGLTMADNTDNAETIFLDKAKTLLSRLPPSLVPHLKYNSRKELTFDRLGSTWRVATATSDAGRSRTLHFVHYSEVAFFKCDLVKLRRAMGQTVKKGLVVYETTANGFNQAKELWDSGTCVNIFVPWWETPEYVLEKTPPMDAWIGERVKRLLERGLSQSQCNWYAAKYRQLDKDGLRQEYPLSPEDAFVSSGECMFDKDALIDCLSRAKEGIRGRFAYTLRRDREGDRIEDIRFEQDEDGIVTLHRPPQVWEDEGGKTLEQFSIGGDTSGEGSDYYTAKVVSAFTRETVATMRVRLIDDDLYAAQLYCLGKTYHDALIAVEINFCPTPVKLLAKWGYDNLYARGDEDEGTTTKRLGFRTTSVTRPVILSRLKRLFRDDPSLDPDPETLREMLSFVRTAEGRWEAAYGAHDDLVMALAIAHHAAEGLDGKREERADGVDWIDEHFDLIPQGETDLWD